MWKPFEFADHWLARTAKHLCHGEGSTIRRWLGRRSNAGAYENRVVANDFDIRHFFRRAPREWLRHAFSKYGLLGEFDWEAHRPRKIESLWRAWNELADNKRDPLLRDFYEISLLATPLGKVQIIDEATFRGRGARVAAKLREFEDLYDCAFWAFYNEKDLWEGAMSFANADGKMSKRWRMRANLPRLGRPAQSSDGEALRAALIELFKNKEARGEHCVVHQYRRGGEGADEYYFAYPQHHRRISLEFLKGEMTRRPHRPAFEVIFVHNDAQRTLRVWHDGPGRLTGQLQQGFANAVLGRNISARSPKDERVYNLDCFLNEGFVLTPRPELGIASVEMRHIRVRAMEPYDFTVSIDLGPSADPANLYQRMQAATTGIRRSFLQVTKVKFRVLYDQMSGTTKQAKREFKITTPNFCDLGSHERDLLIQRMLTEHGVELKSDAMESSDDAKLL